LIKKQVNKKYLDFLIDLQVMYPNIARPPPIKKGFHSKSPSMALHKKGGLDLDISIIECSDDKDYTNNAMLNTTDDNILNSMSQTKPFEQSQTQPLRFNDEENKTGEEIE
jgi:hypothetical protein